MESYNGTKSSKNCQYFTGDKKIFDEKCRNESVYLSNSDRFGISYALNIAFEGHRLLVSINQVRQRC